MVLIMVGERASSPARCRFAPPQADTVNMNGTGATQRPSVNHPAM
jgi:hypothetical protein